jgi:hypothetical protein
VRLLGRDAAAVASAVTRRCCRLYDRVQLRPQGRCSRGGLKTQAGFSILNHHLAFIMSVLVQYTHVTGGKVLI